MNNKKVFDNELKEQFTAITNYCMGLGHNVLGKDRMQTNPEFDYNYDIVNWLKKDTTLNNFKLKKVSKAVFKLTDKQFSSAINIKRRNSFIRTYTNCFFYIIG